MHGGEDDAPAVDGLPVGDERQEDVRPPEVGQQREAEEDGEVGVEPGFGGAMCEMSKKSKIIS